MVRMRRYFVGILVIGALALAACGTSGDGSDDPCASADPSDCAAAGCNEVRAARIVPVVECIEPATVVACQSVDLACATVITCREDLLGATWVFPSSCGSAWPTVDCPGERPACN